ncbi:MAG TPA: hypothetical protein VK453_10940 [Micromonosporaceae bacterium]|nr:hypothetical protein [Micromonosporaceae bacterium]
MSVRPGSRAPVRAGFARFPPSDDAPDIDWLLFHQVGVLTRGQALEAFGRGVVRNRLRQGHWQRPARGVILTHNGPTTRAQGLWIAVLASGEGAMIAGTTAAGLEGLRGYDTGPVHILLADARRVEPSQRVVIHRSRTLPEEHRRDRAMPPRTAIARSVVDAAAWARTDDDARALVAAAFQQRRVTAEEIDCVLSVMPRSRRRALVLEVAQAAAGGAHALSELGFLRLCRRFGLPVPDQQVCRDDSAGRRRFLDAYWRRWRLHVEIDGAWHIEVRAWWEDMRRQNDVWIAGDRVLRFPYWAIRHHPTEVATQLRAALTAAGWRP